MSWASKKVDCAGGVWFRGSMPPRLENFTQLAEAGVVVRPQQVEKGEQVLWRAELEHPAWGVAQVMCLRNFCMVPREVVAHDPRLTDEDREKAVLAGSDVLIKLEVSQKNVLRDRKRLLRYLRLFMGDDGLIAVDPGTQKF